MEIRLIACAVIGLLGSPVSSIGQDSDPPEQIEFAVPQVDFAPTPMTDAQKKKAMDRAKKSQEKRLTSRLNLRIAEIRKSCKLTDTQARRLQLAAKGAVKNRLEGFEDRFKRMQGQMAGRWIAAEPEFEVVADENAGAKDQKPAEDRELAAFQKEIGQMNGHNEFLLNGATSQIEDQTLWRTQLKKTLSDEQFQKYEKLKASRRAYRRRAAVLTHVSHLDAELLLDEEQREQLTKVVDQHLGKFFGAMDRGMEMVGSLRYLGSTRRAFTRVNKDAKKFLSPAQVVQLEQKSADPWENFGFLMGGDPFEVPMAVEEPIPLPRDSGYLGVNLAQADNGVALQTVADGLAAAKAGLKAGDVVNAVDGREVSKLAELVKLIGDTKPDQKIKVSILRDGKKSEIEVTLGSRE